MAAKRIVPILLAVTGFIGAGLSLTMLVAAVSEQEWGRVVLYSVTLGVCVEMAVINILKLRSAK